MTGQEQATTVGQLPTPTDRDSRVPAVLTRLVWLLCLASLGVLAVHLAGGGRWELPGLAVDGLTVVMWLAVTFFSGIVHSYSRRYMAGNRTIDRFFARTFAFTLVVMVLVAADSFLLFGLAWLAMGLVMAGLIGHVEGWKQARTAASLARRYFLASSALVGVALATLWWQTGATTISGVAEVVGPTASTAVLVAAGALVLAAMVQSALVPFHTWLLSSMTAPTPASALMHAGFVNAGGVLLVRFGPVVTVETTVMLAIVLVGALSALLGKLLKSVQVDVKSRLGCSTVGQMSFMLLQVGLGYFGAAITHLVLHGFYKAYLFLGSGEEVEHTSPEAGHGSARTDSVGLAVAAVSAVAGGVLFAALTGKGTSFDSGLLLTGLVVLTTLHATRSALAHTSLPSTYRYGAVPLVFLPAIAVYASVYVGIEHVMADLPLVAAPTELTAVHGVVAAAFLVVYLAIETGVHKSSDRLYVALLNAAQPSSDTLLTSTEDYNEY